MLATYSLHKDSYRLTNSLAVLGNLSTSVLQLHPHAARMLVDALRTFLAKIRKLSALTDPAQTQAHANERSMCEDACVLLMEVLNAMLEREPARNVHLLYELLHQASRLQMPASLSQQPVAESLAAVKTTAHIYATYCSISD